MEIESDEVRALASAAHRQLTVLWLAAAAFAVVGNITMALVGGRLRTFSGLPPVAVIFLLGGMVSGIAAFVVPGRFTVTPSADSALVSGIPGLAVRLESGDPVAHDLVSLYSAAFVTLFLCYTPAVLACIFLALWDPTWVGIALSAFALMLLALRFPRLHAWMDRLESARRTMAST